MYSYSLRAVVALLMPLLLASCVSTRGHTGTAHQPRGAWHTVVAGETLASLAQKHQVSIEDLEELNGLDRTDGLVAGRRIFLPSPKQAAPKHQTARRVAAGGSPKGSAQPFIWPVPGGKLSSRFGQRDGRPHEGIDIAAAEGDPIVAAADGRVLYEGSGIRGYGNLVMLRHANDLVTIYAHNRRNLVEEGQMVRQGEVIAEVGRSGRATGFHLHFEVRQREKPTDPLKMLGR